MLNISDDARSVLKSENFHDIDNCNNFFFTDKELTDIGNAIRLRFNRTEESRWCVNDMPRMILNIPLNTIPPEDEDKISDITKINIYTFQEYPYSDYYIINNVDAIPEEWTHIYKGPIHNNYIGSSYYNIYVSNLERCYYIDIGNRPTDKAFVTNAAYAFFSSGSSTSPRHILTKPISDMGFENVRNLNATFYGVRDNFDSSYPGNLIIPYDTVEIAGMDFDAADVYYSIPGSAWCGNNVITMYDTYMNASFRVRGDAACGPMVRNLAYAYYNCRGLINAACGDNVVNMSYSYSLSDVIRAACGSNVINMYETYYQCNSLIDAACGPNVKEMYYSYYQCNNLIDAACGPNVVNMIDTYLYCGNLINAVCGDNVKNMYWAYAYCNKLRKFEIGKNVVDASYAYYSYNINSSVNIFTEKFIPIPELSNNLINIDYVFNGQIRLNGEARIPRSVKSACGAFAGTSINRLNLLDADPNLFLGTSTTPYSLIYDCYNLDTVIYPKDYEFLPGGISSLSFYSGYVPGKEGYRNQSGTQPRTAWSYKINKERGFNFIVPDEVTNMSGFFPLGYSADHYPMVWAQPFTGNGILDMSGSWQGLSSYIYVTDTYMPKDFVYNIDMFLKDAVCGPNVINFQGAYTGPNNLPYGHYVREYGSPQYTGVKVGIRTAVCGKNVVNMQGTYRNQPYIETLEIGNNVVDCARAYEESISNLLQQDDIYIYSKDIYNAFHCFTFANTPFHNETQHHYAYGLMERRNRPLNIHLYKDSLSWNSFINHDGRSGYYDYDIDTMTSVYVDQGPNIQWIEKPDGSLESENLRLIPIV